MTGRHFKNIATTSAQVRKPSKLAPTSHPRPLAAGCCPSANPVAGNGLLTRYRPRGERIWFGLRSVSLEPLGGTDLGPEVGAIGDDVEQPSATSTVETLSKSRLPRPTTTRFGLLLRTAGLQVRGGRAPEQRRDSPATYSEPRGDLSVLRAV